MKNSIKLGLAALALTAFGPLTASAQNNNAYARIIRPLTLSYDEEANFGAVYSNATGGLMSIVPNATNLNENPALRSLSGIVGVNLTNQNANIGNDPLDGDGIEQGSITISGEQGFNYHTVVTTSPLAGPGPSMALSNVTFVLRTSSGGSYAAPNGTLPGNPLVPGASSQTLNWGATATVAAGQTAGQYTGSITVTPIYN